MIVQDTASAVADQVSQQLGPPDELNAINEATGDNPGGISHAPSPPSAQDQLGFIDQLRQIGPQFVQHAQVAANAADQFDAASQLGQQQFVNNLIGSGLAQPQITQDPRLQAVYQAAGQRMPGPYDPSADVSNQGPFQYLSGVLGGPAQMGADAINAIPTGGGENLGQRISNLPTPLRIPAQFAVQNVPYAASAALDPALAAGFFGAQGAAGVGAAAEGYRRGQLTGQQALAQGGMSALQLLPIVLPHLIAGAQAAGQSLSEYAASPEGQALVAKFASERGSVKLPGEPPEGEPQPPQEPAGPPEVPAAVQPGAEGAQAQPSSSEAGTGGAVLPAADNLPPPPETAHADVMPPENQKLISLMGQTVVSDIDRSAALKQARSSRAGTAAGILSGEGAPSDLLAQAGAARAGKILPEANPIVQEFTPEELTSYKQQIVDAFKSGQVGPYDATRASDALDTLLYGRRQLQPGEVKLLGRIYGPEFEAAIPTTAKQFTLWQNIVDAANLPRTLIASADLSAPFRQGILLAPGHPGEFTASFGDMLKAALSDKNAGAVDSGIQKLGSYDMAVNAGLDHVQMSGIASNAKEESFMSRLAERIPVIGHLVRGSERAYVTFLNDLRFRTFDSIVRGWEPGTYNQGDLENLARYLNNATGRGSLGVAQSYAPALNAAFFSPRFIASRLELAGDLLRPTQSSAVRVQAMRDLGAFIATGIGVMSIAKLGGANVQLDPRASDFGKVNGVDFWGGYQQIARYVAQAITREQVVKGTNGDVTMPRDFTKVFSNFIRSKLAPVPSTVVSLHTGRDFAGNSFTPKDFAKLSASNPAVQLVAPLAWQDLVQSIKAQGLQGAATGSLSTFGFGVTPQTQSPTLLNNADRFQFNQNLQKAKIPTADTGFQSQYWQQQFAGAGLGDPSQYKTFAAWRSGYINYWTQYGVKQGMDAGTAKAKAAAVFDGKPVIKTFHTQLSGAVLKFWKAHPDLLKQGVQLGVLTPSKQQQQILGQ